MVVVSVIVAAFCVGLDGRLNRPNRMANWKYEEIEVVFAQMRKVMRESGRKELPALAPRPKKPAAAEPAGMGGMDGGMGGSFGGARMQTRFRSNAAPSASQPPDLLQGVQEMNRGFQGKQSENLQKMYSGGQGGAGGAF